MSMHNYELLQMKALILIQIKTAVTSRWHQLGEALGINKESLDGYSNHPPKDNIVEILDQWLRSGLER